MKLHLLDFIRQNSDWKRLIQDKPFSITVKEDENYYLFSYSQIDSDFSQQIVKECRGIILRKDNFKPVCVPFFKFHNVQEGYAATIDWGTARVTEKVDGSIIKVWFDDGLWHISTNGTIDAKSAGLAESALIQNECQFQNYEELFLSVFPQEFFWNTLQTNKTYMFELVSPFNRVVVPYSETEIYHIGTRNNETFEESDEYIGIQQPNEYALWSVEECLKSAEQLPFSEEGYVARDDKWNRVKIKSPAYVAAHHLKNNGIITMSRIVDMIKANGQDDFISVYTEYTDAIKTIERAILEFSELIQDQWNNISQMSFASRKDLAMVVNKTRCPSAIYSLVDGKADSALGWLFDQQNDKLLKWIGVE